jgi:hypothetical protein
MNRARLPKTIRSIMLVTLSGLMLETRSTEECVRRGFVLQWACRLCQKTEVEPWSSWRRDGPAACTLCWLSQFLDPGLRPVPQRRIYELEGRQ